MLRFGTRASAIAVAAIAIGCSPGKELPDEVKHDKVPVTVPVDPGGAIPDASNSEAKAIGDRAILAFVQGKPELLAKCRVSKVVGKGNMYTTQMSDVLRTVQAVWQDAKPLQARVVYDFGGAKRQVFGLSGDFGWTQVEPSPYQPPTIPTEVAELIKIDLLAQHWFALGFVLAEPGAVLFESQPMVMDKKQRCNTIKIGPKGLPQVYLLAFDEKTDLLARIVYCPLEMQQQVRVRKVVSFTDYHSVGGLMLPMGMEMRQVGLKGCKNPMGLDTTDSDTVTERWTVESWEFPDKLDEAGFKPPSAPKQ